MILLLSNLVLAFVFLSAMSLIYFLDQANKHRAQQMALLFISLFSFASLNPIWEWSHEHTTAANGLKRIFFDYQQMGEDLPLTFAEETLAVKTNYLSGFTLQEEIFFVEGEKSLQVVSRSELFSVLDSYVIMRSPNTLSLLPTNWWLVSEHDQIDGSKFQLYRSLSDNTAQNLSAQAADLVIQEPSAKNYQTLYGALINSDESCEAYQAWIKSHEIGTSSGYIQIISSVNCFCPINEGNKIDIAVKLNDIYPGAYIVIDQPVPTNETILQISNNHVFYQDPRTLKIPFTLAPDRFYSYSVAIQADQPVIGLFIKIGKAEWYLPKRSYPESWTNLKILFSTYAWDSHQEVILSPVLFDPTATVEIKDYQLTQIELCADQQ